MIKVKKMSISNKQTKNHYYKQEKIKKALKLFCQCIYRKAFI